MFHRFHLHCDFQAVGRVHNTVDGKSSSVRSGGSISKTVSTGLMMLGSLGEIRFLKWRFPVLSFGQTPVTAYKNQRNK